MEPTPLVTRQALRYSLAGAALMLLLAVFTGASLAYSDQPQFCGSCHSMREVHATYATSNHKQFTCGDCHLPQQNLAVKIWAKTRSGVSHVYHETLQDYPTPLVISRDGRAILADNCRRCHLSTVENTMMVADGRNCMDCHRSLVHQELMLGTIRGKEGLRLE